MAWIYDLLSRLEEFILSNVWVAPFFAFLLPVIEAVLPSLPLTVIVAFNISVMSSVYGSVQGTIYTIILSTLGSFFGMLMIFGLIRLTLAKYFSKKVEEHKYGRMFLNIVHGPNIWVILLVLSNPFFPSSILNYALSLTKIKLPKYIFLTLTSRLIIILFLVFLGSVFNLQAHPINILWVLLVYFVLLGLWFWYIRSRRNDENSIYKNSDEK
jgi:uncharacterized membrane protein YdjX (TVP38/TMEM64 family)